MNKVTPVTKRSVEYRLYYDSISRNDRGGAGYLDLSNLKLPMGVSSFSYIVVAGNPSLKSFLQTVDGSRNRLLQRIRGTYVALMNASEIGVKHPSGIEIDKDYFMLVYRSDPAEGFTSLDEILKDPEIANSPRSNSRLSPC